MCSSAVDIELGFQIQIIHFYTALGTLKVTKFTTLVHLIC